jgi:hypothetical protein
LIKKNKDYCALHSITHILLTNGYEIYPPWWRKVFLVKELLLNYDGVLWVDTDAAIVGHEHFKTFFIDKHFFLSPNPPMFNINALSTFSAPFCAGIWGVKASEEGKILMKVWSECYDPGRWKRSGNAWIGEGVYGGASYEQGAFEIRILRCKTFSNWLNLHDHHVFNYLPKSDKRLQGKSCPRDVFAIHYWKGNRDHIKDHWPSSKD